MIAPLRVPWIVGRPALLEHAVTDFLNELARQQPWKRARSEALLEDLLAFLDPAAAAPLEALTVQAEAAWLAEQDDFEAAAALLNDLHRFLEDFGWSAPALYRPVLGEPIS